LIPIDQSLEWESRMTFGTFSRGMIFFRKPLSTPHQARGKLFRDHAVALPLAVLIALSAEALGQETVGKSTGPDDAGQLAFNNACRTCHTLREGDNRLGPSLHKIIGRRAGSLPDYGYSSAMKDAGMAWDKATLDRFIANPDQVVSGNKMKPYGGLSSAEERAKIVAFLEANGGS